MSSDSIRQCRTDREGVSLNSLTSFLDLVYLCSSGCLVGPSDDGGQLAPRDNAAPSLYVPALRRREIKRRRCWVIKYFQAVFQLPISSFGGDHAQKPGRNRRLN